MVFGQARAKFNFVKVHEMVVQVEGATEYRL